MNFVPIVIINLILLVITVLLATADMLLVTYGPCKITVYQEETANEFTVEGGTNLLSVLTANNVKITSSCGGKGSCGYCKVHVLSGGGPILPTGEIFMSREEKLSGMRLACQIKVKGDLEIQIPDFLTTVKTIVKNKAYNPKLRWRIIRIGQEDRMDEKAIIKFGHKDKEKVREIIEQYIDMPGPVVPVLQRLDSAFNYLPEPVLRFTAKALKMPVSEIYRIATLYNAFSLKPRGMHIISVCLGTACYLKGAGEILVSLEKQLGIKTGQTTEDMMFSLNRVSCIGCCGQAPVIRVGEDVYGLMTPKKVLELIDMYKEIKVDTTI